MPDTKSVALSAEVKYFTAQECKEKEYDFELVGYTGGVMTQWGEHFVFDLDGMDTNSKGVVVLREHERDRIVGFGVPSFDERGFIIKGKFSNTTTDGKEVRGLLSEGIPLQCSVGISPEKIERSEEPTKVNGTIVPAGVEIWSKSYVGEVSICSWGVDTNTSVRKFAKEIDVKDIKMSDNKVEKKIEEVIELKEKLFAQDAVDVMISEAVKAERARVASIFSAGAPKALAQKAIEEGLDEGASYKMFWEADKKDKIDGLAELKEEAPVVETEVKDDTITEVKELGYMELISKEKADKNCSTMDATASVMKNHPKAYAAFLKG